MKVRSGFVSNSSSSSFIVAVDGGTEVEIVVKVDLSDYGKIIKTEAELKSHFEYEWGKKFLKEDEWIKERYEGCVKAIRNGKTIILGSFASDGDAKEAFLYETGIPETPGIEVIQSGD